MDEGTGELFSKLQVFAKNNLIILVLGVLGLSLLIVGLIQLLGQKPPEVNFSAAQDLKTTQSTASTSPKIAVDIEGAVQKPGVFRLPPDARVQDALIAAGGISAQADRNFIEKSLNLAQKLTDGAKIYIPRQGEVATSTKLTTGLSVDTSQSVRGQININSATLVQLDTLPGVGQVIGQKIIDNRPYSDISQLVSKKIVSQKTFDKLKDSIGI
ncbi:MAG: hypothetical protein COX79_02140 [Candidatus Levybacteria bacterium CG_4_10_14_0_2_um_filter_36_16]|nr:MAG: hypothetical protein AUK12_02435 [Candidatus Levybacteria bacterium CG2_30_37_29]PIZ97528.1 MAG: hypothetical protein COX79_02140 [Candidatus Levybacteria bacterium CG_4_10_14_0_2_um_filter_36_16]PJA90790.1 MAG: hypothetical protein CO136_00555 [Candidatus Levybacteria bacterium CG_4_9_14_3_um_filter_36_7]